MRNTAKVFLMATLALALVASSGQAKPKKSGAAWLGVYTQSVDSDLAETFELSVDHGAIVNEVVKDSPADKAGLKEDDIIISFNGSEVTDADELIRLVGQARSGDKATVGVMRDGREKTVEITLGRKHSPSRSFSFDNGGLWKPKKHGYAYTFEYDSESRGYIGVTLMELTDQLGDFFGVAHGEGVLITGVEEDSPAEKAGLKAGDVIVGVDGEQMENAGDLQETIGQKEKGDKVTVDVIRKHRRKSLTVAVEERDPEDRPWSLRVPDMPLMNMRMPGMKGLWFGNGSDKDMFFSDDDDLQEQMQELREELRQLRKELRELRRSQP